MGFMFVFVRLVCEDFIRNKFVKINAMLALPCPMLVGRNFFLQKSSLAICEPTATVRVEFRGANG